MISFEGDTGPYLQYAHVRLASIERRNPQLLPIPPREQINTDLLMEPKVIHLSNLGHLLILSRLEKS